MDMLQKNIPFVLDDRDTLRRLSEFKAYCEKIPFIDPKNPTKKTDWGAVMFASSSPEKLAKLLDNPTLANGELLPHQAFLLAFFKMLETPRQLFNDLPADHRQLYYRQILGFKEHDIIPDQVVVSCRLTENKPELVIPAGVELDAGQDSHGTPRRYQLDTTVYANQGRWTDLRWVVPEGTKAKTRTLFDLSAGIGWPQEGVRLFEAPSMQAAGGANQEIPFIQARVVSSPVLAMSGGKRHVSVEFEANDVLPKANLFTVELSSAGKWLSLKPQQIKTSDKKLELELPPELAAITPAPGLDGYPMTGPLAQAPLLKITRSDSEPVPKIKSIGVTVDDLPNVLMSTDEGVVKVGELSYPFGQEPKVGAGFNLVAPDWYVKPNLCLTLAPAWANLPKESFKKWYAEGYPDNGKKIEADEEISVSTWLYSTGTLSLKTKLEADTKPNSNTHSLFEKSSLDTPPKAAPIRIQFPEQGVQGVPTDSLDPRDWPSWVHVQLEPRDFMHREYWQELTKPWMPKVTIKKIKNEDEKGNKDAEVWESTVTAPPKINPPYTPQLQQLAISYTCQDNKVAEQYLLTPFGYQKDGEDGIKDHAAKPQANSGNSNKVKDNAEKPRAYLYLGFTHITPKQNLNLYWRLQSPRPLKVRWQYLNRNNGWALLDATVHDETNNLFQSGLWSSAVPNDAALEASWMPPRRYWIRGVVMLPEISNLPGALDQSISDYPQLLELYTNSTTATLVLGETLEAAHFERSLPAHTITRTLQNIEGLEAIIQPQPSYGGRGPESEPDFLTRVTKHLEHRGRALTWSDMKSLLLEYYPEVYDVRVATPIAEKKKSYRQPVQRMVVIPAHGKMDNSDLLRPTFNPARLERMAAFLRNIASPWLRLQLENPSYKTVTITYKVDFKEEVNLAYGKNALEQALKQHYMPWHWDNTSVVQVGKEPDYFEVARFIQQHEGVEKVKSLEIKKEPDKQAVDKREDGSIATDTGTIVWILAPEEKEGA